MIFSKPQSFSKTFKGPRTKAQDDYKLPSNMRTAKEDSEDNSRENSEEIPTDESPEISTACGFYYGAILLFMYFEILARLSEDVSSIYRVNLRVNIFCYSFKSNFSNFYFVRSTNGNKNGHFI